MISRLRQSSVEVGDATNTITNSTGDLIIENSGVTTDTVVRMGTTTTTTTFQVQDSTPSAILTIDGAGASTFSGDVTFQAETTKVTTVATITTAGNVTYTAAQLQGGLILRDPNGADRSDNTVTAATLVAGVHSAVVGSSYNFTIENTANAAETITLTAIDVSVTLDTDGVFTIAENENRTFKVVFTNVTGGTESVTIYSIGNGGYSTGAAAGVTSDIQYNSGGLFAAATLSAFQFTDNATAPQMDVGASDAEFTIQAAAATPASGEMGCSIVINGGAGDDINTGGDININGGVGSATDGSNGGSIYIYTGLVNATNGSGGDMELFTSDGAGTGGGGNILILSGGATTGDGGDIELNAGASTGGTDGIIRFSQSGYGSLWPTDTPAAGESLVVQSFIGSTATLEWASVAAAPGGADTQLQYNDGGVFGGTATVTWDDTNSILDVSTTLRQNISLDPVEVGSLIDAVNISSPSYVDVQGDLLMYLTGSSQILGFVDISDPTAPTLINSFTIGGGFTTGSALKISGKYAFVTGSTSDDFFVFDISDPSNVTTTGDGTLTDATNLDGVGGVDVQGSYAFAIAGNNNSVCSIDISDPTAPVIVDTLTDGTNLNGPVSIMIQGPYAYICAFTGTSFAIVDISDPTALTLSDSLIDAVNFSVLRRLYVLGNYAYLGTNTRFLIIDITDKTAATIVGNVTDGSYLSGISGIVVTGNYAYIGDASLDMVSVWDVSDKTAPTYVSSVVPGVTLDFNGGLTVQGRYLYTCGSSSDSINVIDLRGVELTNVSAGSIRASDLTVDANTDIIGNLTVATGAQINNSLAVLSSFSVNGPSQFHSDLIQDITRDPVEIGSLADAVNINGPFYVEVQGDLLVYLTGSSEILGFVDISDPTAPALINNVTVTGTFSTGSSLRVCGKYAFATSTTGDDLYIWDISDPSNITAGGDGSIADATNLNGASGVDVSGSYAYVIASINDSISSIDISDPANPTIANTLQDATNLNNPLAIMIQGPYAYVCSILSTAFNIIDISNPNSLTISDTLTDATNLAGINRLYVSGNYAYVTTTSGTDRFLIIDITDKTAAVIVANVTDASYLSAPSGIFVTGSYAYISDSTLDMVSVWDVSDRTTPVYVSSVVPGASLDFPTTVKVQGRYLYTCGNGSNSVNVIDIHGVELTNVTAGNIRTTELMVDSNTRIMGSLSVATGAQINNSLAVMSNMTVHNNFDLRGNFYPQNIVVKNKSIVSAKGGDRIVTKTFAGIVFLESERDTPFRVENPHAMSTSNVLLTMVGPIGEVRLLGVYEGGYEAVLKNVPYGIYSIQYLII